MVNNKYFHFFYLEGIYEVITPKDLAKMKFATAGHPYSLDSTHRDVEDRLILIDKARLVCDAIAVVVAKNEITAEKELKLLKIDYEILQPVFDAEESSKEDAPNIHEDRKDNILTSSIINIGDIESEFKNTDFIEEVFIDTRTRPDMKFNLYTSKKIWIKYPGVIY